MATSPFLKRLSEIGKASRPTKTAGRNKSVQDSFLSALEKQIDAVNGAIKKAGSVQWNRGHWVKPEANGRYSVSFGFPAIAVVEGKKFFFVDDLKEALDLLENGKGLVEDKNFVAALEAQRAARSGPRQKKS
ncbi:hypothetical protein [Sinorhizobium sp. BG8]|uniref:hypothetical protein n=1 Tax=Sinorhizobium sp. BG8 TaxID=2613773 RepID=UPI00193DB71B|nr:hypothetical protein [Sinorhizobium sp. BG8]QRM54738.1 hypothetical protein F3Y30_09420 [Sinorhizobium sp. BG8]